MLRGLDPRIKDENKKKEKLLQSGFATQKTAQT